MKYYVLLLTFACANSLLLSQVRGIPEDTYTFSSNVNSIMQNINTPQVNANGTLVVNVPLYKLECGDISIPLSLTYNASGIKVAQRSTIVGIGWVLNSGGVITRNTRGRIDEARLMLDRVSPDGLLTNYFLSGDISYLGNFPKLNRTDWNESSFLEDIGTKDGYAFNDGINSAMNNYNIPVDLAPDIFDFTFGDISGSFALNHEGKWIVDCSRSLKVEVQTTDMMPIPSSSYNVPRGISTITITNESGVKYFFGINYNSIEYSRGRRVTSANWDWRSTINNIVPTSWYLSKVVSPNGDEINYEYDNVFQITGRNNAWSYYLEDAPGYASGYTHIVVSDCQLANTPIIKKITTSKGTVINFSTSQATERRILEDPNYSDCHYSFGQVYYTSCFNSYSDFDILESSKKDVHLQLDNISILYKSELKSFIGFRYESSATERLKLKVVEFKGDQTPNEPQTFSFFYNSKKLPSYLSGQEDMLGYYNGTYWLGQFNDQKRFTVAELQNQYLPSRNVNPSLMSAETLTDIKYPSGGSIHYDYEPNYYSAFFDRTYTMSSGLSSPAQVGGLRLKDYILNDGRKSSTTNFYYVENYVENQEGTKSSGILYDNLQNTLLQRINAPYYEVFHTIGSDKKPGESPIIYSEITQRNPDNSFIVRKFNNYNSGTAQKDNAEYLTNHSLASAYDNRKSFRSSLKSTEYYSASKSLLKKISYNYRSEAINDFSAVALRTLQYSRTNSSPNNLVWYTVYPQYCLYDYVTKQQETDYSPDGEITKTTNYFYNDHTNQLQRVENIINKGKTKYTVYKYPTDLLVSDPNNVVLQSMIEQNIVGPTLETIYGTKLLSGASNEISHEKNEFSFTQNNLIKLKQSFATNNNVPINTNDPSQITISNNYYDEKGNVLEQIGKDGQKMSYKWDYNLTYPTVKILNAGYSIAEQQSVKGFGDDFTTHASYNFTLANPGTISFSIYPSGGTTAHSNYTYSLYGPTIKTGQFCIGSQSPCNSYASFSFSNMPAGNYSLTLNATTGSNDEYKIATCVGSYPVISSTLTPEFYYEGFEQNDMGGLIVTDGSAHTGKSHYNATSTPFYVQYNPPSTHSKYFIEWWAKSEDKWSLNRYIYQGPMSVSGIIDDIRIYPSDAQMTTSTYNTSGKITSSSDANNRVTYYMYDGFSRLSSVKDQDGNIIKAYCYNYDGQLTDCRTSFQNLTLSKTFIKNNCADSAYCGEEVDAIVSAGRFTSDSSQEEADSLALDYLNANGQSYANSHGQCLPLMNLILSNYEHIAGFTIQFTSVLDSNKVFLLDFPEIADSTISLQKIPQGRYNILISKTDNAESFVFTVSGPNGDIQVNSDKASWVNVPINGNSFNKIAIGIGIIEE